MNTDFWKDKKVFLTGHNGFKGSWMTLFLQQLGAKVCGFSLSPEKNSLYSLAGIQSDIEYEADLRDEKILLDSMSEFQPDIIIHLGALSFIQEALKEPKATFEINVLGLLNVLEAARKVKSVKAILIVTSDKCYKNQERNEPYEEDEPLGAQDPYSTSKACQELLVATYRHSYYKDKISPLIATARASNVIGGGDFHLDRLVPYILDCFIKGEKPRIRNPRIIRPWQNILDVLKGYLTLVEALYQGNSVNASAFNFGPEKDGFATVEHVIEQLSACFSNSDYVIAQKQTYIETNILKIDSKKAKQMLNWKPIYTLDQTLKMTAEFEIRRQHGEDAKIICQEYIKKYLQEVPYD